MNYLYFTDTKYNKLIESFDWSNEDKNYYEIICLKEQSNAYEVPRDVKIYLYKYKVDYIYPQSKKFKVIYEDNGKYYQLILYKLRKYITKQIFDSLSNHHKLMVINMYNKGKDNIDWTKRYNYTYVYINVTINQLTDINCIKNLSLINRIDCDIIFDVYNSEDIENIYGSKELELLNLDYLYDHLDFENKVNNKNKDKKFKFKIDNYSNYIVDLEYYTEDGVKLVYKNSSFDDTFKINKTSRICHNLLYWLYYGSKVGRYGYTNYKFDNYLAIVKVTNGYMYVYYCVDDASCAGFVFQLYTRVYETLNKLWDHLNDVDKCIILKANLNII